MSDVFVKSFTHLKDRPKADRALPMLQRVASLVKPIMRKRGWVLPVLAEFFPDSPNLVGLNVNGGEKILLRLRPAWAPDTFYEEDQVVRVMLHELTHNVHGPHDEKFYKYLAGLEEEYDTLRRTGYAGEGFFSVGRRLGTNVSHDLPPHLARLKALEAAEKRRKMSNVMSGGGRLGGQRPIAGLNPRELAAMAAIRRAEDEKSCGSGAVAEREAAKAANESIETNVIDLTGEPDEPATTTAVEKPAGQPVASSSSSGRRDTGSKPGVTALAAPVVARSPLASLEWSCLACTLINNHSAVECDACQSKRPVDRESTWSCLACGESGMAHEFWMCRFCGTVKVQS